MIPRDIQPMIENLFNKGKVIVIYGARRVGKTTLAKQLLENRENARYINCELLENKTALETTNSAVLKSFLGNYRLIVLDEAQYITDIGRILKIMADNFPEIQLIATGSSSFELGNRISEPLTGRAREFMLYPLSLRELLTVLDPIEVNSRLDWLLRFGLYPEVYGKSDQEAIEELSQIASTYLYKDVLQFENLKRPELLLKLLNALALQVGSEVSLNELSQMLGFPVTTIQRYIDLLEKAFVIFRLRSFSRNLRKEIGKGQKVYFYDLGIRNALIRNFNPLHLRNDTGALWENFCIVERMKVNMNRRKFVNSWFWRTYDQKEVDYIEEEGGSLSAFEFKFRNAGKGSSPREFIKTYPEASFQTVTSENYPEFLKS